jgi:hypothetical protein
MAEPEDDGIDHELIAFLRSLNPGSIELPPLPAAAAPRPQDTKVLSSAEHVCDYALDVALDQQHTKDAARMIYDRMRRSGYSAKTWSTHELHPKVIGVAEPATDAFRGHDAQNVDVDDNGDNGDNDDNDDDDDDAWRTLSAEEALDFVFTMDLLNFCFWSDQQREEDRFAVFYRGRRWTGYRSLLAALWRARDEGIPICYIFFPVFVFFFFAFAFAFAETAVPIPSDALGAITNAFHVFMEKGRSQLSTKGCFHRHSNYVAYFLAGHRVLHG